MLGGLSGLLEKEFLQGTALVRDGILDDVRRDTNVTGKRGQKQPYFTLFGRVIFIKMAHIKMCDRLWYQEIFLNHSIGLRANLIAIGKGKSLYCPSGTVFAELRRIQSCLFADG